MNLMGLKYMAVTAIYAAATIIYMETIVIYYRSITDTVITETSGEIGRASCRERV